MTTTTGERTRDVHQQETGAGRRRWPVGWVVGLLLVGTLVTAPPPAVAAEDAPGFGTVELIDDGLDDRWVVEGDGDPWSYVPTDAACPGSVDDATGDGVALRAGAGSCAPAEGTMTASLDGLVVTGDAPTVDLRGRQQMTCAPLDRCELEFAHTLQGRGVASGDEELSDYLANREEGIVYSRSESPDAETRTSRSDPEEGVSPPGDGYYHLSYELHRRVVEDPADEASVAWQFVDHATFTDAMVVGAHPERVVPSGIEPGTSTVSLVSADGWGPGADVTVSGAGVTVEDVEYLAFDEPLQLTLAVDGAAPTGPRDVTIAYPNTPITRICHDCLAIVTPPPPNGDPDAELTGPATALSGQRVTFDASGSTDPEGRDLTYAWEVDGDGLFDDGEGATMTTALTDLGARTVAVRVRDPRGARDTDEVILDVLSLDQAVATRCDGVDGVVYPDGDADVSCLSGLGLVEGFRDGTFRPDRLLTRGEASGLLDRWVTESAGAPLPDAGASWPDVDGGVFAPAIGRLTAADIVHGFVDGTFRPGSTLTRGQYATLLDRAITRVMGAPLPSDGDGGTGGVHAPAIARLVAADVLDADEFAGDVTAPVDRSLAARVLLRALVAVAYRDVLAAG